MVDGVAGTSAATTATKGSNASLSSLSKDFDSFLVLLTTQLKNQDPTSPMETNEFTQQIIGFSQVEQSINSNKNLEKLIEMNKTASINNAVSYVDRFIEAETDTFNYAAGSKAFLSYDLPKTAKSVSISVTDEAGNLVKTIVNGGTAEGGNKVQWDGTSNDGNPVKAGKYKISLVAKDMDNVVMEDIKTYSTEMVSQVDLQGAETVLYIGDIPITMDKVKSVKGFYSEA